MTILLVNTNPVVSRLFALCVREGEIELEEVSHISLAKRVEYDMIFIDDNTRQASSLPYDDVLISKKRLLVGKHVYDEKSVSPDEYDDVLTKPFFTFTIN